MSVFFSAVGKGKLFWFFSVGNVCRKKPNVLDRAVGFYTDAQRFGALRRLGLEVRMFKFSTMFISIPNVQFSTEAQLLQNPCCAIVLLCRI
jgi:hypothetical protein